MLKIKSNRDQRRAKTFSQRRFQVAMLIALMATLICSPVICSAEITLALTKGFVKKLKDKATISTSLKVDKHHDRPNDIDEDGDIHLAGRDTVVLLPMVVEIVNGKRESDTMQFLLQTSAGEKVDLTGVWRLWFEHPGSEDQTQGKTVKIPKNSNPDHVFEIHPVTKFGGFDCLDSFVPIVDSESDEEFTGHAATKAFPYYDQRKITISRSNTAIMLTGSRVFYNYTDFFIKLADKPKDVGDGFIVSAAISATKNFSEPLVEGNRRMIFAKGSPPADKVKALGKGDKLRVLGIPRVNLNEVFLIASGLDIGEEEENPLPYEMIIVAVLK